jgi:hypothetical protein
MQIPISLEDIILYFVAVLPGIIDIEVGRTCAAGVDKSLEVEVEVDGINISDFQTICNN